MISSDFETISSNFLIIIPGNLSFLIFATFFFDFS